MCFYVCSNISLDTGSTDMIKRLTEMIKQSTDMIKQSIDVTKLSVDHESKHRYYILGHRLIFLIISV